MSTSLSLSVRRSRATPVLSVGNCHRIFAFVSYPHIYTSSRQGASVSSIYKLDHDSLCEERRTGCGTRWCALRPRSGHHRRSRCQKLAEDASLLAPASALFGVIKGEFEHIGSEKPRGLLASLKEESNNDLERAVAVAIRAALDEIEESIPPQNRLPGTRTVVYDVALISRFAVLGSHRPLHPRHKTPTVAALPRRVKRERERPDYS
jgi:hypothetical protein